MADISETSGGEHRSYFDGCLLSTVEILLKDIEERPGEKLKEPYIVYMIKTSWEWDDSLCILFVLSGSYLNIVS